MGRQWDQRILLDFEVPAGMRDGTILRANFYRPASEGQWPVLLTRLPYGKDFPLGSSVMDPAQVARRGFVVIFQGTRGPFTSEGGGGTFFNQCFGRGYIIQGGPHIPFKIGKVGTL